MARYARSVTFYIALSSMQAWQCLRKQFQQRAWACCARRLTPVISFEVSLETDLKQRKLAYGVGLYT